jgi:hypothetical protein
MPLLLMLVFGITASVHPLSPSATHHQSAVVTPLPYSSSISLGWHALALRVHTFPSPWLHRTSYPSITTIKPPLSQLRDRAPVRSR